MAMIGLGTVLAVSSLYGSYGLAGQVVGVYVIVHSIAAPKLGQAVDRYGQARVMGPALTIAVIGLIALAAAIQLHAAPVVLFACMAIVGATIGSMGALVRSRWVQVIDGPAQIHTAFSFESTLDEAIFVIGPILATFLATAVHPIAGLVLPVIAIAVGGTWFLSQRETEPPPQPPLPRDDRKTLLRDPVIFVLLIICLASGGIFGAADVSVVAFATEFGQRNLSGATLAALGVGSLLGGLGYGLRSWRSPLWRRFVIGAVILSAAVSMTVLTTNLGQLVLVMFIAGFSVAPTIINSNALAQQTAPAERLTEALAWISTAAGVGVSIGSWVGGVVIDGYGGHAGFWVVAASGLLVTVTAVAGIPLLRRSTKRSG